MTTDLDLRGMLATNHYDPPEATIRSGECEVTVTMVLTLDVDQDGDLRPVECNSLPVRGTAGATILRYLDLKELKSLAQAELARLEGEVRGA